MSRPELERAPFRIRSARLSDVTAIAAATTALVGELRGAPTSIDGVEGACRHLIEGSASGAIFLAERGDEAEGAGDLWGFIALSAQAAMRVGGVYAIIQELWVSPAHRSVGVGAGLIAHAEAQCRERGWTRVEVGLPGPSFRDHARTAAFYRSCAYVEVGPRVRKVLR